MLLLLECWCPSSSLLCPYIQLVTSPLLLTSLLMLMGPLMLLPPLLLLMTLLLPMFLLLWRSFSLSCCCGLSVAGVNTVVGTPIIAFIYSATGVSLVLASLLLLMFLMLLTSLETLQGESPYCSCFPYCSRLSFFYWCMSHTSSNFRSPYYCWKLASSLLLLAPCCCWTFLLLLAFLLTFLLFL
jgi:hypothetical protein